MPVNGIELQLGLGFDHSGDGNKLPPCSSQFRLPRNELGASG
jgi:hypothetical protein